MVGKFFKRLFSNKLVKRFSIGFAILSLVAIVFFLLRGPYLSNSIKRVIQPVLENAVGERIIIDRAVINLFPLYLQTKGFKVFDKEGNRLLWITKMRVYVDVLGLFANEIRIRRLTVTEPDLAIDKKHLETIIASFKERGKEDNGKKFNVSINNVKITDGEFIITDEVKKAVVSGNGLDVGLYIKKAMNITISLKDGTLKLPNVEEFHAGVNGNFNINNNEIKILEAKIHSSGSTLEAKGEMRLSPKGIAEQGTFSVKATILTKTIAEIFGLKEKKDGSLSLSGSIDLVPVRRSRNGLQSRGFKLDLKTKGSFYLETLMELLKVNEKITGRLSVDGKMTGVYPQIIGSGMVNLENAELGKLHLDAVEGGIGYKNKKFSLRNFVAQTFGGEFKGDAFLTIPSGEYFLDARAKKINSRRFFEFIDWKPPFPEGRINGPFTLNKKTGNGLELVAHIKYVNPSKGPRTSLAERLNSVEANLELREGVLTIITSKFSTYFSELLLDGNIDITQKKLDLNIELESKDVMDLTAPYFRGLRAPVTFRGKAEGSSNKPKITGDIKGGHGSIHGKPFTEITGDLTYSPELLSVGLLKVAYGKSAYEMSGSIAFKKSEGPFSFRDPYFKVNAVIKNSEAQSLIAAVYKKLPITGVVNGTLSFEGGMKDFKGDVSVTLADSMIYNQPIDRLNIKAELSPDGINISSAEVFRGETGLEGSGFFFFDKRFNALISSKHIDLNDIAAAKKYPVDAHLTLDMTGSGTFQNPYVDFSLKVMESSFRDFQAGKGDIKGQLKDKKLSIKADLFEGVATADAVIAFSDGLSWDVTMRFVKGRYDFLLAGFLKDAPKDLSASLEGMVNLKGEKNKFSMNSQFSSLNFSLYGYNFTNRDDIVLEFKEDTFKIKSFSLSGRNADITAAGSVIIGKDYNLTVNGKINLVPLQALTQTVESLKGMGGFALEVKGPWQSPELEGQINIKNAVLALKGLAHKIGPVNGDIFLDKNRITFESLKTDFAGGSITLSGNGYMDGLSLERLLIASKMKSIRLRPANDLDIDFDGELFFETSPKRQSIFGDINIKKARYKKRVEWKSWLISFKEKKKAPLKQPSFLEKTALNVHVTGQDEIFIDNNIVRTPVKIDLNVQGTVAQFGLIGRVESKGGKIFFRNNEFNVIEASADFIEVNRVVPVFHIIAETFTSGYRIRLNLDGPIDRFDLSLFSDPPLSDTQIFALLTSGRLSEEEKGFESGLGAGEATAFLTGKLQDVIEERFKYITGFDRLEVNPHTTSTGAVSPRVTVGKKLLGEKLFVTYSTSMGTTELNIIRLQYDLNRNFSIIGLRDEIGSVGADVKYRFEFK